MKRSGSFRGLLNRKNKISFLKNGESKIKIFLIYSLLQHSHFMQSLI